MPSSYNGLAFFYVLLRSSTLYYINLDNKTNFFLDKKIYKLIILIFRYHRYLYICIIYRMLVNRLRDDLDSWKKYVINNRVQHRMDEKLLKKLKGAYFMGSGLTKYIPKSQSLISSTCHNGFPIGWHCLHNNNDYERNNHIKSFELFNTYKTKSSMMTYKFQMHRNLYATS